MDIVDDALVLAAVPYGDADVVVHLFLRGLGRTSAFARSAQRSTKRFPGGLRPLSWGRVTLRERPREAMPLLVESALSAELLRTVVDPVALGRASYLVELVERLLPERLPSARLFDETRASLIHVAAGDARLLRRFELILLDDQGSLPALDAAVDDPAAPVVAYDPREGALLAHPSPASVPFSDAAARAALALKAAPVDALPDVDDETLRVVGRVFAAHLRTQHVGPLKSVAFLRQVQGAGGRRPAAARDPGEPPGE